MIEAALHAYLHAAVDTLQSSNGNSLWVSTSSLLAHHSYGYGLFEFLSLTTPSTHCVQSGILLEILVSNLWCRPFHSSC